jgi:serine/threonine-protein kinase
MNANDPRLSTVRDSLRGVVLRGSSGTVTYHLRDCIGEGGQGWVFRATWDDPGGVPVIVKVLRPDAVGNESLRRFQREAEVLRMLSTQARPNPYVVRFYDHAIAHVPAPQGGEPLALPFTVLEYVHGTNLEHVLKDSGGRGLAVERARRLARHITQALEHVHAQKIVHRDLKPSNILLTIEGGQEIAKVTDFGLVKLVDVNLQRTAALAGASLGYAPPEQYEQGNQRVSARTDVFSLASIVYEMLCGKPAFPFREGENPLLIVTRILNSPRPQLVKVRETLPLELAGRSDLIDALDAQLRRALAADPADRHESAADFFQSIEPTLRSASEESSLPPRSVISGHEMTRKDDGSAQSAPAAVVVRGSAPKMSAVNVGPASSVYPAQSQYAGSQPAPVPGSLPGSHPSSGGSGLRRAQRENEAAAQPAAWSWSIVTRSVAPFTVRSAVIGRNAEIAFGVGPSGIAQWHRGQWIALPTPPMVDLRAVRGITLLPTGEPLVYGDRALAVRLLARGGFEVWNVPDTEISFLGCFAEETGVTTLVGERPYRGSPRSVAGNTAGVLCQFAGDRLTLVTDAPQATRLNDATRLTGGAFVACGDWGALVRLEMGVAEHLGPLCGGHLLKVARLPDGGAVLVGAGGHALSLSAKLEHQLEAVQTTRDLLAIHVGEDGVAWAGSAQTRVLRRTGGNWVRMSGELGLSSSVAAVYATARAVRAVCDDGAVIEGLLA